MPPPKPFTDDELWQMAGETKAIPEKWSSPMVTHYAESIFCVMVRDHARNIRMVGKFKSRKMARIFRDGLQWMLMQMGKR